jgi:TatD DNase family protein
MLIDTHAHLDMVDFDKDRQDVIDRAIKGGLTGIITIGIDLDSSAGALELARQYDFIYAAAGYHPHNADTCDPQSLEKMALMASDKMIVAWGEIGLDFYRHYSSRENQLKIFEQQLKLADDLDLPVIIHDRDAHDDVLEILKKRGKGERRGVIHCFSGDLDLAHAFIELGYFISIPGTVTYQKAEKTKNVAAKIPMERMLIETDAPFLAPVPKRGKNNEPLFVIYTAKEIARLRDMEFEEVAERTAKNAIALFGLEK